MNERRLSPAERYERDMVAAMFRPFAEDLVNSLELAPPMHIADIGCGTGIVARVLAERLDCTCTVTGVDINAGMLAVARQFAMSSGCKQNWIEASASSLPFEDGSIDLTVSQHAFMLFDDKKQAAREMHRVLREGGRAFVSAWRSYRHQPHFSALIAGLEEIVEDEAAQLLKCAFSFESDEPIRVPLVAAGFDRIHAETVTKLVRYPSVEDFVQMEVCGSIIARVGIEVDDDALERLCAAVAAATAEFSSETGMIAPMQAFVVGATK